MAFLIFIGKSRTLLTVFSFPTLRIEEAEAQCALLNLESLCVRWCLFLVSSIMNQFEIIRNHFKINQCWLTSYYSFHYYYYCQDGCFSSDSDIFLFGAKTVYRDIHLGKWVECFFFFPLELFGIVSLINTNIPNNFLKELGEEGHVVCYEMADIERKLGYGRNSLVSFYICWSFLSNILLYYFPKYWTFYYFLQYLFCNKYE